MTHHTDHRTDFDQDYDDNRFKPLILGGIVMTMALLVFLFFRESVDTNKQFGLNTNWSLIAAPITAPSPVPRTNPAPSSAPLPVPGTAPGSQ